MQSVRNSVTIDWTMRENVRARIRVMIKRILRKYARGVNCGAFTARLQQQDLVHPNALVA